MPAGERGHSRGGAAAAVAHVTRPATGEVTAARAQEKVRTKINSRSLLPGLSPFSARLATASSYLLLLLLLADAMRAV